jgi:enamine deaminase RidA (YjgF/YER057c/UK114 family)
MRCDFIRKNIQRYARTPLRHCRVTPTSNAQQRAKLIKGRRRGMRILKSRSVRGPVLTIFLCGIAICAQAQDVGRLGGGNPKSPIAQAPPGSPERMGDTHTQTISSLARIKDTLTSLGLTFGDVVKATVFMVGDPAKGGEIDFAAMNMAWSDQFGTAQQPNKPARSTIKVAGLAGPGALVEIEMIAVKKN